MLAVKETSRVSIDKPESTHVQRRISRMIEHLRDQYQDSQPQHAMPSNWLIGELVLNAAKKYILNCDNWQQKVRMTLKQIIRDTSYDDCLYINDHNNLPLFPNNELFNHRQVYVSMKALLCYLDDE